MKKNFIIYIFLIISIVFKIFFNIKMYDLIISPFFWIIYTIYLVIKTNNNHGRFSRLNENMKSMIIIVLLYIILNFLGGLIFGFVKNPFSNKINILLKNIWQIIVPIIGIEYFRSVAINENINNKFKKLLITITIILLEINLSSLISNFNDNEKLFMYFFSIIFPIIVQNILYNYLTQKGSYKLVLIYRLSVEFVYLVVPILPNYDWFITGIREIVISICIYLFIKYYSNYRQINVKKNKKVNNVLYFPLVVLIIIFVFFLTGVFKYKPVAILSNSMNPIFYKGDVIIYSKVDNKKLKNIKLYTIIIYSKKGRQIIHRVVKKYKKDDQYFFITKGDANIVEDYDPVSSDEIIGIYNFRIKYIGYPSVWLNELLNSRVKR